MANQLLQLISATVLCIVSGGGLYLHTGGGKHIEFADAVFISVALYALLSVIKAGMCNESICNLHAVVAAVLPLIAIPFLATEIWLKHNVMTKEAAYSHAAIGGLTALIVMVSCVSQDIIDFVVLANAVSLAAVGVMRENYFALGASLLFLLAHIGRVRFGSSCGIGIDDFYDYLLAGFSYCAVIAICRG